MRRNLLVVSCIVALAAGAAVYVASRRPSTAKPQALGPIKPEQRVKARIQVPDLDGGRHVVMAELVVPSSYYMAMWGNEVTFRRLKTDPKIALRSLATEDSTGSGQSSPLEFIDQTCGGVPQGRRAQIEHAADGWSIVCQGEEPKMPITVVVRDLRSLGNELQCVVKFSDEDLWRNDGPDLSAASDHGNPSSSRVSDALAICGSVTLRPIREEEFHEQWNGHEWVTSSGL